MKSPLPNPAPRIRNVVPTPAKKMLPLDAMALAPIHRTNAQADSVFRHGKKKQRCSLDGTYLMAIGQSCSPSASVTSTQPLPRNVQAGCCCSCEPISDINSASSRFQELAHLGRRPLPRSSLVSEVTATCLPNRGRLDQFRSGPFTIPA
jgi:hypothetical protein